MSHIEPGDTITTKENTLLMLTQGLMHPQNLQQIKKVQFFHQ